MGRDALLQDGVVPEDDDRFPAGPPWDGPFWDAKFAVGLVGKRVLVAVTEPAPDGSALGQRHFWGRAVRADWRAGIVLRLEGARAGEELLLPPDTRAFRPAAPGEYRLPGTGEVVRDPDFLAAWPVHGTRRGR